MSPVLNESHLAEWIPPRPDDLARCIRAHTPAVLLEDAAELLAECGVNIDIAALDRMCRRGELRWFPYPHVGIFVALDDLRDLGLTAGNRQ